MDALWAKIGNEAGLVAAILLVAVIALWRKNESMTTQFVALIERQIESNANLTIVLNGIKDRLPEKH